MAADQQLMEKAGSDLPCPSPLLLHPCSGKPRKVGIGGVGSESFLYSILNHIIIPVQSLISYYNPYSPFSRLP